jgi:DNA-binding SARP family transcriptional activator
MPEEERLAIRLLGELVVARGAARQPLPASKKTRALLGYLVIAAAAQTRSRLCDLLWDTPDDPRAALRWSLTRLRPLVDEPTMARIVANRETVAFEAEGADVDLADVTALIGARGERLSAASTEALEAAARRFSGELLEGLELPDCYRYHEWLSAERERVRGLELGLLDAIVTRLNPTEPERALEYARRRVAIDPLDDTAHASVVRILARLGRRADASAQIETCQHILSRELGGRRSPALDAARVALAQETARRRESVAEPRVPSAAPVDPPPDAAHQESGARPLVGRRTELVTIQNAVAALATDRASEVLLISGEPGIGKTRLAEELVGLARAAGASALIARTFEAEQARPYGVWADLARHDKSSALRAPFDGREGDASGQQALFDAVVQALYAATRERRLTLVIDDLQWLDGASAALFHYVLRQLESTRVLFVFTARSGELDDNAPVVAILRSLRLANRLRPIELGPLDAEEIGALARLVTSHDVDSSRVFEESGGNPLFAREIARALAAGEDPHGFSMAKLVEDRLTRLDGPARDALLWAAALGRSWDPALLARASGAAIGAVIERLGALIRAGIVTLVEGEGELRYAFSHELVRRAVLGASPEPMRRLVHLGIARTLEGEVGDDDPRWSEIVHHASMAQDARLAAAACERAGAACLRMCAPSQAREFARRGVFWADRLPDPERLVRRSALLWKAATAGVDSSFDVESELERTMAEARERDLPQVEAACRCALAEIAYERGDDDDAVERNVRDAASLSRHTDDVDAAKSLALAGYCLTMIERDHAKANDLLREAESLCERQGIELSDLYLGLGLAARHAGDREKAQKALERGVSCARRTRGAHHECVGLKHLAMLSSDEARWSDLSALAERLVQRADLLSEGSEAAFGRALGALARLGAGDPAARQALAVACDTLAELDARGSLAYVLTRSAEIDLERGEAAEARSAAERAVAAARVLGKPSGVARALAALARVAKEEGDHQGALELVAEAERLGDQPDGLSAAAKSALASARGAA